MTDADYSKREIDGHFDGIKESLANQDKVLVRIETQSIKTNGRVTELERSRYMQMGAMTIISAIVLPILMWSLYTLVNIQEKIDTSVKDAFKEVTTSS